MNDKMYTTEVGWADRETSRVARELEEGMPVGNGLMLVKATTLERLTTLEEYLRALYMEVDIRIEHGAESGGHLEYFRDRLAQDLVALRADGIQV